MPYGTVSADLIVGTNGGRISPENTFGFRNRLINGAMTISQRNAGASITPTADGLYSLDRWQYSISQASKFSIQQNAGSVTPPVGYINYLGVTSLSNYAVLAGDYFVIQQNIEGLNIADLGWGTANAKTVTLSFQVYSSLTGTFGGSLRNDASSRSYPFSYSIPTANTWTTIFVTIAGDTTGTWLTTNGTGIRVTFSLGMGSTRSGTANAWAAGSFWSPTGATSVVGTNGATFYITGVQFEVGSNATSFEYRPYGTELLLCQRYYEKSYDINIAPGTSQDAGIRLASNSTSFTNGSTARNFVMGGNFSVVKRASPTVVFYTNAGTIGNIAGYSSGSNYAVSSYNGQGQSALGTYITTATNASTSEISTFHFTASAEL